MVFAPFLYARLARPILCGLPTFDWTAFIGIFLHALGGLAAGIVFWSTARPDLRQPAGPEALARRFD